MKILLVIDQFDFANNGTTISARRFAEQLRAHGNEVRIVTYGNEKDTVTQNGFYKYTMPEMVIPVFDRLIKSQGMTFAKPQKEKLYQAVEWADIVHFLLPFALSVYGERICRELGKPCTAAFHCQPENITSSIKMGNAEPVNKLIYHGFRDIFYNKFTHIHCPSHFIADQLTRNGYTAKLHVISNGISPSFYYAKREKCGRLRGKKVIVMIGRLSREKRQDLLIDAVMKSKYRDSIQIILAGDGPLKEQLRIRGKKLPLQPIIRFFTKEQLICLLHRSDLYVHTADVEIEAISCIEAIACGLVPVISDSKKSATQQFALDERSLFRANDCDDLTQKIDYWLSRPDEKAKMEKEYAQHAKKYNIDSCVSLIEAMFREEIEENAAKHL